MFRRKHSFVVFVVTLLLCCMTLSTSAQETTLGSLTVGQPLTSQISAETPVLRYDYTVSAASVVGLQAFGETVQPTITVLRDGVIVASDPNPSGLFVAALNPFLSAGSYVIEV